MTASENVKIDLTGTHEEAMKEIDAASITDEFKEHLREEYHKVYDDVGEAYIVLDTVSATRVNLIM